MIEVFKKAFWDGLKPDEILSVSEWADKYRMLSSKAASEPGMWRTSRTPYLKEIMDCLSTISPVEKVSLMKGAQVGGTEAGNNWIGYVIDHSPAPTMMVQPTVETAKRNSKQRIAPMIEECPTLQIKVKDPRSRDSGNTVLMKEFPGGVLVMTGANSGVGLRSMPVKNIFLDEIDGFPPDVDGEGNPTDLAIKRTATFSKRKILEVSTPTIENRSNIENSFQAGDMRYFFVPCPHCGHFQYLKFSNLKFEKENPLDAQYQCEECTALIENWQKTTMLAQGEWRPTNPDHKDPKVRSYHLSSLYSPVGWLSWGEIARDWVNAQGNQEKLKTFINTVLGETWKDQGDAPDWKLLYARRENYEQGTVPNGVVLITAGADVQKDRIEVEIVGWGRNKRSWSIDYRIFHGDTSSIENEPWRKLEALVYETFSFGEREMPISCLGVDSGYNTQTVYAWCRKFPVTKVIATKGSDSRANIISQPTAVDVTTRGKTLRRGMKLFIIGVSIAKQELYGWLRQDAPIDDEPEPYGFCHFPQYDDEFFKMMCAEQLVTRWVKARKVYEWEKIRERNEALDCRIIARAAASLKGLDRFKDEHWTKMETEIGVKQSTTVQKNVKVDEKKTTKTKLKRRKSRFL